jgi:hypothetical protein
LSQALEVDLAEFARAMGLPVPASKKNTTSAERRIKKIRETHLAAIEQELDVLVREMGDGDAIRTKKEQRRV